MTFIRAGVVAVLFAGSVVHAGDWSRFRGPEGSGVNPEAKPLPTAWSPEANLLWKTELPGAGVSSPIVVGDRVFVTCYSGYGLSREEPGEMKNLMRHLVCLDAASGKVVWTRDLAPVLPEDPYTGAGVPAHGYASHTPTSDGERVYVYFGKSGAMAFDMDGNQLWQTGLGTESDPSLWGTSSSPIVYDDLVIVTASAESQSIVGLDKKTGSIVWRQEASGTDNVWGTPMLHRVSADRTDLVLCVPGEIWGMDPSSGKLRWFAKATDAVQAYASAVADDENIYAVTGRGGGSIAVKTGGKGDVSDQNVLWTGNSTGSFASPVVYQGKLYSIASGVMTVIDAESGEKLSEIRLQGGGGGAGGMRRGRALDYASPLISNDHLYYLNGTGNMFVFKLGDEPSQVRINRVTQDGESFGGTPAISDGRLYLRSDKHLYCVADKGNSVPEMKAVRQSQPIASQPGGGRRGGGGRFDPAAFFGRLDQNQDGKLTEKELTAGPMAGRLSELDRDKDQAVSLEEFRTGMQRIFRGGGGRRGGGYQRPKQDKPERPRRPQVEA